MFLDVTRAYSAQGLSANKFFKVGNTGYDYVIIKDAGWAVKSVEWQKNVNGNNLIGTWTGLSVYADKNTPTANNAYQDVDVVVTVEGLLPPLGGMVSLEKYDPPNACVSDGYVDDNYSDTFSFATSSLAYMLFMPGQFVKTATATVSTNSGNNYHIKATGGTTPRVVYSEVLTVWRRLWVEFDALEVAEFNDMSLATAQLNRACVMPMLYPDDNNEPMIISVGPVSEDTLYNYLLSNNSFISGRDSPISTSSYWTVRVVTIHSFGNILIPNPDPQEDDYNLKDVGGCYTPEGNTIFLCRDMIENDTIDWNQDKNDNVNSNQALAAMLLHELCHALIDGDERDVDVANNQYPEESYCVRDTFWEACPYSPKYHESRRPDMRARLQYAYLIDINIRDIQSYSRVRI